MATKLDTPAPPELAARVFGDRLPLAQRYVSWLLGSGVERGLVGPREADRVWQRHILNCVGVASLIGSGVDVVDIGSGAGLPGLVLAIARPDLRIVLVESMLRRTSYLDEVVADLGLSSVEVRRGRAEELRLEADVVTARAVAPLDRLAGWAGRLLRPDGIVLALKGSGVTEEIAAAWRHLRRAQLASEVELLAVVASDTTSSQLGISAREVGVWQDGQQGPRFTARDDVPEDERLALIVRLHRSPRASRDHQRLV